MSRSFESRFAVVPAALDHYCARCLGPVSAHAVECSRCSRRFVGRGRFDRLPGPRPQGDFLSWLRGPKT